MIHVSFDENGKFAGLVYDDDSLHELLRALDSQEQEEVQNILKLKLRKKNRNTRHDKASRFYFCTASAVPSVISVIVPSFCVESHGMENDRRRSVTSGAGWP